MAFDITEIRAYAENYTEEELKAMLKKALELKASGGQITSATSAGGGSFTKTLQASPSELVKLYQAALDYKLGRASGQYGVTPVRIF